MERLTQKEKNKRFMAERVALLEYMDRTGTDAETLRKQFFDAECIKENIPGWAAVMGSHDQVEEIALNNPRDIETVEGSEIIPAVIPDGVPPELLDRIEEKIIEGAERANIEDLTKCAGVQWRSICQYVGFWLHNQPFIRDTEREKQTGQPVYNGEAVALLLPVWAWYCGRYKHPPLVGDFIAFVGCSSTWFYGNSGHAVTSTWANLTQKAREIEEAGLAAAVADSKEMPVGRIFLLKARHGYKEASEVIHTTAQKPIEAAELPRLGTESK